MANTKWGRCEVGQCDVGYKIQLLTWDKGANKGKYKCQNCLEYIRSQRDASAQEAVKAEEMVEEVTEVVDFATITGEFIPFMAEQMQSALDDAFAAGVMKGKGKGKSDNDCIDTKGDTKGAGKGGKGNSKGSRAGPYSG